jgi:hypothetical protein
MQGALIGSYIWLVFAQEVYPDIGVYKCLGTFRLRGRVLPQGSHALLRGFVFFGWWP